MKEKNPGLSGASILTCGANAQRAGYAALPGPIPLSVSRHCRGARDSRSTGLKPVAARSGARSKCLTTRTGQDSSRNACAIPWTEPFACCSEQRPAQRRKEHCARRSPCSVASDTRVPVPPHRENGAEPITDTPATPWASLRPRLHAIVSAADSAERHVIANDLQITSSTLRNICSTKGLGATVISRVGG